MRYGTFVSTCASRMLFCWHKGSIGLCCTILVDRKLRLRGSNLGHLVNSLLGRDLNNSDLLLNLLATRHQLYSIHKGLCTRNWLGKVMRNYMEMNIVFSPKVYSYLQMSDIALRNLSSNSRCAINSLWRCSNITFFLSAIMSGEPQAFELAPHTNINLLSERVTFLNSPRACV